MRLLNIIIPDVSEVIGRMIFVIEADGRVYHFPLKNLKHFIREVRSLVDDICADYQGDPRVMKLYKMLKGF